MVVALEYLCAKRAPSSARRMVDACDESWPVMYASFWCVRRMSGDGANGYSVVAGMAGSGWALAIAIFVSVVGAVVGGRWGLSECFIRPSKPDCLEAKPIVIVARVF